MTRVAVERPAGPGTPVRVRTSDGLLAARLVSRDEVRAEVALVASGAMLLGGDHVVVGVRVDPGCALTLTDVGGTVAYDGDGAACRWDTDIQLGAGATLAWAGLPFVVAAGADAHRATTVRLGAGSHLALRETVVLGRTGERGGRVVLRLDVADDAGPVLVEELTAAGDHPVPGVLGDHAVIDTVTTLHGSPDADRHSEPAASTDGPADIGPGRGRPAAGPGGPPDARPVRPDDAVTLCLERGGTLTRWLGAATHLSPLEPPALAAPTTSPEDA
ncbi:hypothetical protein GCM10027059_34180 [Myceligenerans halotolerans]